MFKIFIYDDKWDIDRDELDELVYSYNGILKEPDNIYPNMIVKFKNQNDFDKCFDILCECGYDIEELNVPKFKKLN